MRRMRCQTCHAEWRGRSARYCGVCGEPLVAVDGADRRRAVRARRAGRLGLATTLLATTALAVVVAGGSLEGIRRPDPPHVAGPVDLGAEARQAPSGSATGGRPRPIGDGLLATVQGDRLLVVDAITDTGRFAIDLTRAGLPAAEPGPTASVTERSGRTDPAAEAGAATSVRAHRHGAVVARGGVTAGLGPEGAPRWLHRSERTRTRVVDADAERVVLTGPTGRDPGIHLFEVLDSADGSVRFGREVAALLFVEEQSALVRDLERGDVTAVSLDDGAVRWRAGASEGSPR